MYMHALLLYLVTLLPCYPTITIARSFAHPHSSANMTVFSVHAADTKLGCGNIFAKTDFHYDATEGRKDGALTATVQAESSRRKARERAAYLILP